MSDRNSAIAVIKSMIVPYLRAAGFKGSFPHFRRPNKDNGFDLLSFQFDKWGGAFYIELSVAYPYRAEYKNCYLVGLKPAEDEIKKLDVGNTLVRYRLSGNDGDWFRYETIGIEAAVSLAKAAFIRELTWYQNPPIYDELEKRKARGLIY
ncbi:MAG: DUF4304 domain-containing protein [Methanocorpusculum sp.]|nr:DUF4304 domain-containing protein [Oscillospiraceae bacterium]MBQ3569503.1 DUF4304 domain-containing protein [Methanocorpusculum sp.]